MKNKVLLLLILFSFSAVILSCERSGEGIISADELKKIENRAPDCDDCPAGSCCCEVVGIVPGTSMVQFCGTVSPDVSSMACGPYTTGSCTIEGYWLNYEVSPTSSEHFCMSPGSSMRVLVSAMGHVRITCRSGQSGATSIDVADGYRDIYVDGNCDVSGCN